MSLITHAPLVSTRRILQKLGVPDDVRPSTAWLDLVAGAADWYAAHGRPWRTVEELAVMRIEPDRVHLDPTATLNSAVLARGFATADVSAVQLVAVSAGIEVDIEIDRLQATRRPDAAGFLAAYGVSVSELLREEELAAHHQLLPPYAPGYLGWQLHDQAILFGLLHDRGPLLLDPSSCLTPLRSSIAVAGVARFGYRIEPAKFWAAHGGHSCNGDCLRCNSRTS